MTTVTVTKPPSFELSCECHPVNILNPQMILEDSYPHCSYAQHKANGGSERHIDSPRVTYWWATDPRPQEFSLTPPSWASSFSWTYPVAESPSSIGWSILDILLFRFVHWPDDLGEKILFYCNISSRDFGKGRSYQRFCQGFERETLPNSVDDTGGIWSHLGPGLNLGPSAVQHWSLEWVTSLQRVRGPLWTTVPSLVKWE